MRPEPDIRLRQNFILTSRLFLVASSLDRPPFIWPRPPSSSWPQEARPQQPRGEATWGFLVPPFSPPGEGGELGGIEKGGYSVDGEAKIWRRMRYKYPLNHQFTVPTIILCCTNLSGRGFFHCLHFRVQKLFRNLFAESALSHSGSPAAARFLICSFLEHFQSFWGKFWGEKSEI